MSLENAVQRMKGNLKKAMLENNVTRIDGETVYYRLSKAKAKLIIDDQSLPGKYLMEVVVYKPDNERIRHAIESGETITGAQLEPSYSLRSYLKKKEEK